MGGFGVTNQSRPFCLYDQTRAKGLLIMSPRYGGYDDDSFKKNEAQGYSTLTTGEKVQGRLCSMCQHGTTHFCVNCRCCAHICNCGKYEDGGAKRRKPANISKVSYYVKSSVTDRRFKPPCLNCHYNYTKPETDTASPCRVCFHWNE